MVTKKIRTEYMKKFREPKWETFSKCYEDSLKYRLTRRVMEHTHKPWFWEGSDSGSDSSGKSTPRVTRNKVSPLSVRLSPPGGGELKSPEAKPPYENGGPESVDSDAPASVVENGVSDSDAPGPPNDPPHATDATATDDAPADRPASSSSSDREPAKPEPRRRRRHRASRSEPGHRDSSCDDGPPAAAPPSAPRKTSRAKSQPPPARSKENTRPSGRYDWTQKHPETRRTPTESRTSDACVQTRRDSDKRGSNVCLRRARSADLEKMRLAVVVEDHWMTEYMRCFSARLR